MSSLIVVDIASVELMVECADCGTDLEVEVKQRRPADKQHVEVKPCPECQRFAADEARKQAAAAT